MASKPKEKKPVTLDVVEIEQHEAQFFLLGTSPFICNRVSGGAKRELLLPRGPLTAAQKKSNLKHDVLAEFRDSPYTSRTDTGPTRILMKATAPKGALGQAAIDMPTDIARAQIDRLVTVVGEMIPIWGIPYLNLDVVRNSDIKHTPDMRTRAKLLQWASVITVRFAVPMLNIQSIFTLLRASGRFCGIGDYRQQKGKGSNGLYDVLLEPNKEWQRIVDEGGLAVQDEYLRNPVCSDPDSEDLFQWYVTEVQRRRTEPTAKPKVKDAPVVAARRKGNGARQQQLEGGV